jgi:hypothetical protein
MYEYRCKQNDTIVGAFQLGEEKFPDWFIEKCAMKEITIQHNTEGLGKESYYKGIICTITQKTHSSIYVYYGHYGDYIIMMHGLMFVCPDKIFKLLFEKIENFKELMPQQSFEPPALDLYGKG